MELTRSGLTYPEVSSKVYHDSFCQLGSSISLPWVIYFEAFYLQVVSSFSCIPVICPKSVLFLTPLHLSGFFPRNMYRHVNKNPTDATVCRYLFIANLLYMFCVSQHPSSGVLKTVPAASGTGHNTGAATSL